MVVSWSTIDYYLIGGIYGDTAFTADSRGNLYTAGSFDATAGTPPITWIVRSQPAAPTNLTATPDATFPSTQIDLSWTNTAGADEAGIAIYRSTTSAASGFTLLATVSASTTTYSDSGLSAGTTYWYQVVALLNSDGSSAPSNTTSATTTATPTAATAASAAVFSSTQITDSADPTDIFRHRKHRR